ncbi:MAG TPA: hypothetical protein VMY99_02255 [Nevskiaceae bacterium]|nr:hypothetical protein [Nevskiaceae bacterium]
MGTPVGEAPPQAAFYGNFDIIDDRSPGELGILTKVGVCAGAVMLAGCAGAGGGLETASSPNFSYSPYAHSSTVIACNRHPGGTANALIQISDGPRTGGDRIVGLVTSDSSGRPVNLQSGVHITPTALPGEIRITPRYGEPFTMSARDVKQQAAAREGRLMPLRGLHNKPAETRYLHFWIKEDAKSIFAEVPCDPNDKTFAHYCPPAQTVITLRRRLPLDGQGCPTETDENGHSYKR